MDSSVVIGAMRGLILSGLQVLAPALLVSLAVALVVGLLQAIMQIQEQTLSFFPKLIALVAIAYFFGPWMLHQSVSMIQGYIQGIPSML